MPTGALVAYTVWLVKFCSREATVAPYPTSPCNHTLACQLYSKPNRPPAHDARCGLDDSLGYESGERWVRPSV